MFEPKSSIPLNLICTQNMRKEIDYLLDIEYHQLKEKQELKRQRQELLQKSGQDVKDENDGEGGANDNNMNTGDKSGVQDQQDGASMAASMDDKQKGQKKRRSDLERREHEERTKPTDRCAHCRRPLGQISLGNSTVSTDNTVLYYQ